jgi:hypothetical protein
MGVNDAMIEEIDVWDIVQETLVGKVSDFKIVVDLDLHVVSRVKVHTEKIDVGQNTFLVMRVLYFGCFKSVFTYL